MNKDCSERNIQNLCNDKLNFSDAKKLMEESFYDTRNHDLKFFKIHKLIFDDILKYFTKINGELNLPDFFSILLYFVNDSDEEKSKIFFNIHLKKFQNDTKNFRTVVLNYMKDVLFLLSNLVVEYKSVHEIPESLPYHLSSFSVEKVDLFFNNYLHKDVTNLANERELKIERIYQILMNISYIFNFNKIREIFLFFFSSEKVMNYSNDEIQVQLKDYYLIKTKNLVVKN